MPQRFPNGSGLVVSTQRDIKPTNFAAALNVAAVRALSSMRVDGRRSPLGCGAPMVENLEARELLSNTWFVSPSGSNSNAGTLGAPFKTIQQAADVAQAGDHVEIETGVYHETVTPAHSGNSGAPIVFEAYNHENVTVSGADPITGWSNYQGSIYSASMPWDLGEGNNEIFVNGVAMNEAEFPNTAVGNVSHPNTTSIQSTRGNTIYDSALNQPGNYWKGAIISFAPGQGWDGQTGVVTSSAPGSITVSYEYHSKYAVMKAGNPFLLFGKFAALDTAGEWYRDPGSGQLYLWAPNGGSPNGLDVEAKHRLYAFNLDGVNNITINGVNVFASTITTSGASRNVVINGITAQYVSQQLVVPHGWWVETNMGITLKGADDVLENSTVAFSSSDAVEVSGSGSIVTNDVIHDAAYTGENTGALWLAGSNVTASHNTVYNSGRHGILAEVPRVTIEYNTVHDIGLRTTEAGGIYTASTNGQGATIAYNQVYNIHTPGYGGTALFTDNNSSDWNVHNNITWNVDYALKMNFTSNNNQIYDNTLGATSLSINSNQLGNWNGVQIYGNVFSRPIVTTPGAKIFDNVFSSSAPKGLGAGDFSSGASGVVAVTPPSGGGSSGSGTTTPPVITPPATPPSATVKLMAVDYNSTVNTKGDNFGGVGYAYNNSNVSYKLDFGTGVTKLTAGIAAIHPQGTLEIHLGSATGTLLGTIDCAETGAWNKYTSQSTAISKLTGVQTVFLVFKGPYAGVANLDWIQFS